MIPTHEIERAITYATGRGWTWATQKHLPDPEAVVGEARLAVAIAVQTWQPGVAGFQSWAYRCASCRMLEEARQQMRRGFTGVPRGAGIAHTREIEEALHLEDPAPTPEEQVIARLYPDPPRQLPTLPLELLSGDQRDAVLWWAANPEGVMAEGAEEFGVRKECFRNRLRRGLETLEQACADRNPREAGASIGPGDE